MAIPVIIVGEAFEDHTCQILARVLGNSGVPIVQADISTITLKVFNNDKAGTPVEPPVAVANVIFDTLQTDARWTIDPTGYNFLYAVPSSVMSEEGQTYRFEFTFTPVTGETFLVMAQIDAKAVWGS